MKSGVSPPTLKVKTPSQQQSISLQSTFLQVVHDSMCVERVQYEVHTDLSNIKWFQSSVLLQDKELIPHPASLHPLVRGWTLGIFLFCRLTQKTVRQKGQNDEDHREQGPGNSWNMQSSSHCEAQMSIRKKAVFPSFVWSLFWGFCLVSWKRQRKRWTSWFTIFPCTILFFCSTLSSGTCCTVGNTQIKHTQVCSLLLGYRWVIMSALWYIVCVTWTKRRRSMMEHLHLLVNSDCIKTQTRRQKSIFSSIEAEKVFVSNSKYSRKFHILLLYMSFG